MAKRETGFNWDKLDAVLQLGATKAMAAAVMDCSEDTIERRIQQEHSVGFKEYRDRKMVLTKIKLKQKAIKLALESNVTMLIFCLKNLCGWSDKTENVNQEVQSFKFSYEDREKLREAKIEE